jgi:hypothetical protein
MKKLVLLSLLIFVSCGSNQETAEDFIPTSEIVWCKANYSELATVTRNALDTSLKTATREYSQEKLEEMLKTAEYLKETLDYIAPEYASLTYETLLVLESFLELNAGTNPDNFDLLEKATNICTTWYNSMNS